MFTKHTGTAAWGHGNGVEDFTKLSLPIGDELTELREVGAMIWWALLCHEVGMTVVGIILFSGLRFLYSVMGGLGT